MSDIERALLHAVGTTDEPVSITESNTLSDAARLLVKYPTLGAAFADILSPNLKAGPAMSDIVISRADLLDLLTKAALIGRNEEAAQQAQTAGEVTDLVSRLLPPENEPAGSLGTEYSLASPETAAFIVKHAARATDQS